MPGIDDVDKAILNRIQSDFPITSRPYRTIGNDLGLSEDELSLIHISEPTRLRLKSRMPSSA